jgi:hypothetical protein
MSLQDDKSAMLQAQNAGEQRKRASLSFVKAKKFMGNFLGNFLALKNKPPF